MNDWPADPKLDAGLRDLVGMELSAARTDAAGLVLRKRAHPRRQQLALAAVVALVAVVVAASLGLRGMGSDRLTAAQPTDSGLQPTDSGLQPTGPGPSAAATPTRSLVKLPTVQPVPTGPASPQFHSAGSMTTQQSISAVLADGRVLFVGGYELVAGSVRKAELYDPATGKFAVTGRPVVARSSETATRLQDGRVLVVGGLDADSGRQLDSAELYDPATGTFTKTGSLNVARQFHTATLLNDGRVLIVGGWNTNTTAVTNLVQAMAYRPLSGGRGTQPEAMTLSQGLVASAELYDPKTGKFTMTGSLHRARDYQTATLLHDGRVLIAGGDIDAPVTSAELYDPSTGKFALSGSTPTSIWLHAATLLQDGRVLITGGRATNDSIYSTACVYDPKTGKFTRTGSMTASRQEHTATLLPDGQVLIAGGLSGASMTANATSSAELYDPKTGKFTPAGTMVSARMDQTADLLSDGSVLIASGDVIGPGGWQPVTSGELYRP
jgi:hypothetical protein